MNNYENHGFSIDNKRRIVYNKLQKYHMSKPMDSEEETLKRVPLCPKIHGQRGGNYELFIY